MVSEARKQSMAWMEMDYSKHTYFRWKEQLGALGTMGETAPLIWEQQGCIHIFHFKSPNMFQTKCMHFVGSIDSEISSPQCKY